MTETQREDIGWAVVEIMGHCRTGAYVTEQELAGKGFLRLEIPATPGHSAVTQLVNPDSIYRLTPTTEEVAVKAAQLGRPEPVHRWELASISPPPAGPDDEDDQDDDGDYDGGPL